MSEIRDGDYNLCENCGKITDKKYLHCSAECAKAFREAANKEIRCKTEKDFENSLEYWRDLAKMLREELKQARAERIVLPERARFDSQRHDDVDFNYISGFNAALDQLIKLNPKAAFTPPVSGEDIGEKI